MPLSPEKVAREVQDIEQRPWPNDPLLPMKNLGRRGPHGLPRLGTIFKIAGHPIPRVVLAGYTELLRNPHLKPEVQSYGSLKEMVEDGWVVD